MDMFNEWKRGDCQKAMKWSPPGRRKRGRFYAYIDI
jgi:hypothetical protein